MLHGHSETAGKPRPDGAGEVARPGEVPGAGEAGGYEKIDKAVDALTGKGPVEKAGERIDKAVDEVKKQ